MSTWRNIPREDVDVDVGENEINILIGSDDNGNNYVVVQLDDLQERITLKEDK